MTEGLTPFQLEVAHLFFRLSASEGFVLAGGAALLANGLTSRPTRDLDFFTSSGSGDVAAARDQLESAARERGWQTTRIHAAPTFVRLFLEGDEQLLIDIALDSAPGYPPVISVAGPTYAPEELAGRKLIALFSRAAARDFADVEALAARFGRQFLLAQAVLTDPGFDHKVLAEMMRTLDRFDDIDLPVDPSDTLRVREFFRDWADDLCSEE